MWPQRPPKWWLNPSETRYNHSKDLKTSFYLCFYVKMSNWTFNNDNRIEILSNFENPTTPLNFKNPTTNSWIMAKKACFWPPGGQKMNFSKNWPRHVDQCGMPIEKMVSFVILPFGNPKRRRTGKPGPTINRPFLRKELIYWKKY